MTLDLHGLGFQKEANKDTGVKKPYVRVSGLPLCPHQIGRSETRPLKHYPEKRSFSEALSSPTSKSGGLTLSDPFLTPHWTSGLYKTNNKGYSNSFWDILSSPHLLSDWG